MQFLYILSLNKPYRDINNWTAEIENAQQDHFNYLKALHESKVMKHVGRTDVDFADDALHGYAIFEAESESAAQQIMNNDPAIKAGLMSGRLLPYIIVFN